MMNVVIASEGRGLLLLGGHKPSVAIPNPGLGDRHVAALLAMTCRVGAAGDGMMNVVIAIAAKRPPSTFPEPMEEITG